MGRHKRLVLFGLSLLLWTEAALGGYAPQPPQSAPKYSHHEFKDFKSLKVAMLDLIGSSKKRVILISTFLTDGDISSALYLAKFRKVAVNVFLSSRNANRYLSRVRFLNQQGISVSNRPRSLNPQDPTLLLVDSKLFRISRDLNVLKPHSSATLSQVSPRKTRTFVKNLIKTFKNKKNIRSIPLPLVGRPKPARKPGKISRKSRTYRGNLDGSFNYDRSRREHRPSNVPTRLPKSTVHQVKQRSKIRKQNVQKPKKPISPSLEKNLNHETILDNNISEGAQ